MSDGWPTEDMQGASVPEGNGTTTQAFADVELDERGLPTPEAMREMLASYLLEDIPQNDPIEDPDEDAA